MSQHPSAVVAGGEAVLVREAAAELHRLGGHRLLPPDAQRALRKGVETHAGRALTTAAARTASNAATRAVSHCGRAAGLGAVFDGGVAAVEAGLAYRRGEVSQQQALRHVRHEAATGAVAAGVGAATATIVVALTGGMAAPAAFVIGAGMSAATKSTLTTWWR